MSLKIFEDEIEANGFFHNVRWQGIFNPAQRGGMTDPSWGAHWEIDGNVEVEIFGKWFDITIFCDELVTQIYEKLLLYMESFQQSLGDEL